ncbi:hypothetical protein H6A12_12900 [Phocea massiliensis]|uniref:Uncharacterized protein n=1 Tax=Merdimmobilis hominis TaxID=2897707 RepID=A0A938X890_9FIRM|nr:hypothetical protein [Merdimmobilis hominis]
MNFRNSKHSTTFTDAIKKKNKRDYMPTESEARLIKDMITEKINEVFGQTPKEFCLTFYETDGLYGEHSNEKPTMGGII